MTRGQNARLASLVDGRGEPHAASGYSVRT